MNTYDQLLRLPDVSARTGLKKSQLYHLEALNQFPRRIKLGRRATAWVASEVSQWIAARVAERDSAKAAA